MRFEVFISNFEIVFSAVVREGCLSGKLSPHFTSLPGFLDRFEFLFVFSLQEKVLELMDRSKSADKLILHLIVRDRNPGSPGSPAATPTIHYAGSPAVRVRSGPLLGADEQAPSSPAPAASPAPPPEPGSPGPSQEEAEAHFHAVTVSERELTEFRMIFDKKKGADGLIAVATVRMVLQSYWRFIHREGFEANPRPFPEERLEQLRRKVDASNGMTLEQFLTGERCV